MHNPFAGREKRSLGERRLFLGHLATGCFGAALALIVVLRLDPGAMFERSLGWYERWIVLSGFLGGIASVALARDRLGRDGWRDPLIGIALMTALGPIIAGTLALPLYGTMFGPFTMGVIFVASPTVGLLWLSNAFMVHLLLRSWHAERDSIFGRSPPVPLMTGLRRLVTRLRAPLSP